MTLATPRQSRWSGDFSTRTVWTGRGDIARLARYAATSGIAFAVSEATLLILYGLNLTTATVAALIASLVGTVPSYLLSRYWIWREAARERVLRQVILYWIVSISCIALTSLLTGALASFAPVGHPFHLLVVAIGYPIVMLTFWLIKFVVYQRIIFPNAHASHGPVGERTSSDERAPL
jgi:putative flippase GtrA